MNEPQEPLPDELLIELLTPLRNVAIPEEARAANREVVRLALARRAQPSWWRRTVAVPVPVAIAATVAIVITVAALFRPAWQPVVVDREATSPMRNHVVESDSVARIDSDDVARPGWSVTRQYLQSLESLAGARSSVDTDTKEKRDAS